MANEQNLVSFKTRSQREMREIGKKGAAKTNEIKKAKKSLKEKLEFAIDIYTKKAKEDKTLTPEMKAILEESDILVLEMMNIMLNRKNKSETKLKAIENVLDRIYGKPKQEIQSNGESNISISWEK